MPKPYDLTVARQAVIDAAECVEADLSGNADNRVHNGYVLIEEARVRQLMRSLDHLRASCEWNES